MSNSLNCKTDCFQFTFCKIIYIKLKMERHPNYFWLQGISLTIWLISHQNLNSSWSGLLAAPKALMLISSVNAKSVNGSEPTDGNELNAAVLDTGFLREKKNSLRMIFQLNHSNSIKMEKLSFTHPVMAKLVNISLNIMLVLKVNCCRRVCFVSISLYTIFPAPHLRKKQTLKTLE